MAEAGRRHATRAGKWHAAVVGKSIRWGRLHAAGASIEHAAEIGI